MWNAFLRVTIHIVLVTFFTGKVHSQDIQFRNYSPDAGLPSSEVYSLHQDKLGYIWFATDRGLSRFNGYTFEVFTTENGLGDNVVFSISEDNNRVLWFLTFSKGLYCYTPDRGFYSSSLNPEILKITDNLTWVDNITFGNNGRIWISIKNPETGKGIYYSDDGVHLNRHIVPTLIGNTNIIKLVGKHGVVFENMNLPKKTDVNSSIALLYDDKDNYGLSTGGKGVRNCLRVDEKTMFCVTNNTLIKIYNNKIDKIFKNNEEYLNVCGNLDSIWLTTKNGVYLFDARNIATPIDHFLEGVSVTDVLNDNEGNYWFSTLDRGVYMAPSLDFRIHKRITEKVTNIISDKKVLYGLTLSQKVFRLNEQWELKYLNFPNATQNLLGANLFSENYLVLSNGLFINSKENVLRNYVSSRAKDILRVENNWIFAGIGGLVIFKNGKEEFSSSDAGFNLRVNTVCSNDSGGLWLGTLFGLYSYSFKNNAIMAFEGMHQRINALTTFGKTVVVGTAGSGVYLLSDKNKINIKEIDGLAGNYISSFFICDSLLWVGTNKGFSLITMNKRSEVLDIQSYSKNDGLVSNEVNGFCYFNNLLWISTNSGLVYINPKKLKRRRVKETPVYINNIFVNDTVSISNRKEINLSYYERNVTIDYANVAFANPDKTYYYYKIDGLQKDWVKTAERSVKLVSLPPGDYTFLITSANTAAGIIPAGAQKIYIHIAKHYSQTWWFFTLCCLLFVAITGGSIYRYVKGHQKKIAIQRKLIQAEQQALRTQMNPHFIFNALNSVQYYITENDKKSASIFLAKFSSLIRAILENSNHSTVSLEEELACISKYLELEQVRFGNKFSFTVNIDSSIPLSDIRIPSMLLQPFLENAIWHGLMPKKGEGRLIFSVKHNNGNIECIIEDDGIGRVESAKIEHKREPHKSTAIENIQKRLQLVRQLLRIEISLTIEDLYDAFGNAAGTKVCLVFENKKNNYHDNGSNN